jgi:radical SAM superfamily enzyme YgiQ (UPF0313 family)
MRVTVILPKPSVHFPDITTIGWRIPRASALTIATVIKNLGHEIKLYIEQIDDRIDWEWVYRSDVVCFSLLSLIANRGYQLASRVRDNSQAVIIMGGSHPSAEAEDCLHYCDYVVRNEGDETIAELLEAIDTQHPVDDIRGISHKKAGQVVHNKNREYVPTFNISFDHRLVEGFKVGFLSRIGDVLRTRRIRHDCLVITITRGCPFNCRFCYSIRLLGRIHRKRDISSVLEEITSNLHYFATRRYLITDNNFFADREYSKEFMRALIPLHLQLEITAFSRLEIAKDDELLSLMRDSGIRRVFVGIESVNQRTLNSLNKKLQVHQIREYLHNLHQHGISVIGSFIVGADTDERDCVQNIVDFAIETHIDYLCMFTLHDFPYQQTQFNIEQLIPDHRILTQNWDHFSGTNVTIYTKNMRPSSLQKELMHGYRRFYAGKRLLHLLMTEGWHSFYDLLSGRYAVMSAVRAMEPYLCFLETQEAGHYDTQEMLLEDTLLSEYTRSKESQPA